MTGSKFGSLVRELTHTNSSTLPDATLLLFANPVKDEIARRIVTEADEDYFGVPQTTNLIANQREYPFPANLLSRIRYVEAKLDDQWIGLQPFDLARYDRTTEESIIVQNFFNAEGRAAYDIFRRSLWLYCGTIEAVTDGLKIWAIEFPADIDADNLADASTDLSEDPSPTTSGMPREVHELWAEQVAIRWKQTRDKPIPLTERELIWEERARMIIKSMSPISTNSGIVRPTPRGAATWNDGFDL